jgi:Ca2+-binding EF-hand superfamily protein
MSSPSCSADYDSITAEVSFFSENVKVASDNQLSFTRETSGDKLYASIADVKKTFFANKIAWSLHQKKTSYLKVVLYSSDKRAVGYTIVDYSSIFTSRSDTLPCVLQVFDTKLGSDASVIGWIFLVLKFNPDISVDESVMNKLLVDKSSDITSPASCNSEVFHGIDTKKKLHVSMAPTQLTPQMYNELYSSSGAEKISLQILFDYNSNSVSLEIAGKLEKGGIVWDMKDIHTKYFTRGNMAIPVSLKLLRDNVLFGQASLLLSSVDIALGSVLNYSIPCRNQIGYKVGIVNVNVQLTSVFAAPDSSVPVNTNAYNIHIEEGFLRDTTWKGKVEPFFQFIFLPASASTTNSNVEELHGFTNAAVTSSNLDLSSQWNLTGELTIPEWVHAASQSLKSNLLIICRDAARPRYPELGRSVCLITSQNISNVTLIDQWISFESPKAQNLEDSSGKIKLNITRKSTASTSQLTNFAGIGELYIRVQEVTQATSDNERIEVDASSIVFNSGCNKNIFASSEVESVTVNKCCVLPITGAKNDINVCLTSAINRKAVYTSTFSPLLGVRAAPESAGTKDSLVPSSVELLLLAGSDSSTSKYSKMLKLKAELSYVPYVQGRLKLRFQQVKLNSSCSSRFASQALRKGIIRAVFNSTSYGFSDDIELEAPPALAVAGATDAVNNTKTIKKNTKKSKFNSPKKLTAPTTAELRKTAAKEVNVSVENSLVLPINTSRVKVDGSVKDKYNIKLYVLDTDSVKEDQGLSYTLCSGDLNTSQIFYDAVRKAASSQLPQYEGSQSSILCSSAAVTTEIELFESSGTTHRHCVGTMQLTLQFFIDGVAEEVVTGLSNIKYEGTNPAKADDILKSKIELSLKQAFQSADKDNSGVVQRDELFAYLKSSSNGKPLNKRNLIKIGSPLGETGTDNLLDTIVSLVSVESSSGASDNDELLAKSIFDVLDTDSDGSVSWWEWKNVLSAFMLTNNVVNKYVNLRDSLLITSCAAHDAVISHNTSKVDIKNDQPVVSIVPVKDSTEVVESKDKEPAVAPVDIDDDDAFIEKLPPSKAVPRLQMMVQSLRSANNTLMERLEKALLASQVLLDKGGSGTKIVDSEARLLDVEIALRKQRDAEALAARTLKSYEAERVRVTELESQLARLKGIHSATVGGRSEYEEAKKQSTHLIKEEIQRQGTHSLTYSLTHLTTYPLTHRRESKKYSILSQKEIRSYFLNNYVVEKVRTSKGQI